MRFVHSTWETVDNSGEQEMEGNADAHESERTSIDPEKSLNHVPIEKDTNNKSKDEFNKRFGLVFVGNGRNPTNAHGKFAHICSTNNTILNNYNIYFST